jgi:hypothetical protein
MAVFRLWGIVAALLAFTAFGLTFHEPDAPRYILLALLVPLALLRVVTGGWGRRALLVAKWGAVAVFLLILVPFVATQVQSALYPQLEMAGTRGFFTAREPQTTYGISDPSASRGEAADKISVSQAAADPESTSVSPEDSAGLAGRLDANRLNVKLNKIILPRLEFREVTVREAVDYLAQQSRELDTTESDPARRGVNIVLKEDVQHIPGTAPVQNIPGLDPLPPSANVQSEEARITCLADQYPAPGSAPLRVRSRQSEAKGRASRGLARAAGNPDRRAADPRVSFRA